MRFYHLIAGAALALFTPLVVQAAPPTYTDSSGQSREAEGVFCPDLSRCGFSGGGNSSTGTNGATAPAYSTQVGGKNPAGNLTPLATDSSGGLVPGTGRAASVQVTTSSTANTISTLSAALAAGTPGKGLKIQLETALTADLFICYAGQSTTCSATVHDDVIVSGTGKGARLFVEYPLTDGVYAVTSQTSVVLNVTRWTTN